MENSVEKGSSDGAENSKKTKCLDLQSLYKNEALRKGPSKEGNFPEQNEGKVGDNKKKRKKSKIGREKPLDGFMTVGKKSRKGLDAENVDRVPVLTDTSKSLSESRQRNGLNGIALNLAENGNLIHIPKRPRGFVGRKKSESVGLAKTGGSSSSVRQVGGLSGELIKSKALGSSIAEAGTSDKKGKLITSSVGNASDSVAVPCSHEKKIKLVTSSSGNVGDSFAVPGSREKKVKLCTSSSGSAGDSAATAGTCDKKAKLVTSSAGIAGESIPMVGRRDKKVKLITSPAGNSREPIAMTGSRDKNVKLVAISTVKAGDSKIKRKRAVDEAKGMKDVGANSAPQAKGEDVDGTVNNADASRKNRNNLRKRRDLSSGSRTTLRKVDEPSVDNSGSTFDGFQEEDDDDEENLERNAARMLSSRFDPRCTGFSSENRTSRMQSKSGLSFAVSSGRNFVCRDDPSAGLRSVSANADGRVLRPRNQLKKKGLSRKRRHFYEVLDSNLDAHWFLNQRIKVFWPLDESWYYGLVIDYDPETKLHHVKYDDRDEEWINLHNEKFKLLLLPSEVPGRRVRRRSSMGDKYVDKGKRELSEDDDSYAGNYLDSEPIISWLARPSRRIKSSPSSVKKQKTLSPAVRSDDRSQSVDSLTENRSSYGYCSQLPARSADTERVENSLLGSPSSSKSGTYIVYFRKRFRKKGEGISPAICESEETRRLLRTFTSSSPASADSPLNGKVNDSPLGCLSADKLCWLVDEQGLLKLSMPLLESIRFKFDISLPLLPFLDYSFRNDQFWLSCLLLLPKYGAIMTTWPEVFLEMLFVDNTVGLRFFLFEVSLKQAVALFAIILSVFNQPSGESKYFDMQFPLTSIRFRLSCIQDLGRQQEFTFYSFSKLKHSKWLYLDSQLQQHCFLSTQLPLSDCTYDNIKSLEGSNNQLFTSSGESGPYHFKKRSIGGMLPMGVSRECARTKMSRSPCNSTVKPGKLPMFALSFAAAPTFFLSLHLKLLMEHNFASMSLHGSDSLGSSDDSEVSVEFPEVDSCLENVPHIIPGRYVGISSESTTSGLLFTTGPDSCTSAAVAGKKRPNDLENGKLTIMLTSPTNNFEKNETGASVQLPRCKSDDQESEQCVAFAAPSVSDNVASPRLSQAQSSSALGSLRVELPSFGENDMPFDGESKFCSKASDFAGNVSDGAAGSPYPTVLRSSPDHDRDGSNSSPFGDLSPVWLDGKSNFMRSGFGNGPRKPRTQVRYTLPHGGYDFSLKHKSLNQRSFPHKRIRRSNEKRISDGLKVSQTNLETLSCYANVLVTLRDKGWRESGAHVVLELTDHEWRLAVKVSGVTKYSHKVNHILQPGSTNRYTHAMMWKGGKEWVLEFPDRSQWIFFKEMYEECYNRNIRAASVKNIPIPGVCLVEESDDFVTEAPFVRNSLKYLRQIESDVEMALNPSHILYDMDSDDEQWILRYGKLHVVDENKYEEVFDELFEKIMDMLEKVAYSQQRDQFTIYELEELMVGVDSIEIVKAIYEHWMQKRQRSGMPLIRHLQPPLWERYQQQVKEWEEAVARPNTGSSSGCKDKSVLIEKPPMFAFCLKPRGLEVPNKGSKHRSQKRFSVSGHHQVNFGDHDRFHNFGKSHEFSDISPSLHQSRRVFSPRDCGGMNNFLINGDLSEWNHYTRFQRNKLKKTGGLPSPNNAQLMVSHNQRTGVRNGGHRWNMELSDWPSQRYHHYEGPQRHGIEQLDGSDFHEFRLRDASSAAQHARNMAKLKREKAQRLLYRADLAIHKAAVALMTAEAIKAASESSNLDS